MTDLAPSMSGLSRAPRSRATRPERITVGGKTFERNDICAKRFGSSERGINRGDKKGAPFIYINGVKYRPVEDYDAYVLSGIQRRNQQPQRRRLQAKPAQPPQLRSFRGRARKAAAT